MTRILAPDLCVIGAGSGGLAVAAGAAQMGAEVVLVERGAMGGDCLNFGCVPSKSLLAAARVADLWRRGAALGIAYAQPRIDFAAVGDSVQTGDRRDCAERFRSSASKGSGSGCCAPRRVSRAPARRVPARSKSGRGGL